LLQLCELVLADALHELVRVGHYLRDQVMLVVVLKVVDLLEVFVVLPRHSFNISDEGLVLEI